MTRRRCRSCGEGREVRAAVAVVVAVVVFVFVFVGSFHVKLHMKHVRVGI